MLLSNWIERFAARLSISIRQKRRSRRGLNRQRDVRRSMLRMPVKFANETEKLEDKTLLTTRSQTLTRDYTWDETLVLGKEKEEQLLREAITDDLVRIVLIQLSSI